MEEILKKIGLTGNEATVYLTLLKIKSGLAGDITKMSGIHRRCVYDAIERLIQKGLVSYYWQGDRKRFQAEKPDRIIDIIHNWESEAKDVLPKFMNIYKEGLEKQRVVMYRGKNGLKSIMDDQIEVGKELYVFGKYGDLDKRLQYWFAQFERRRIKKKMQVKVLFDENKDSVTAGKLPLVESRFFPAGFSGPITTEIYGDKILLIDWQEQPLIIMVQNADLAKTYKKYFEILWESAKKR